MVDELHIGLRVYCRSVSADGSLHLIRLEVFRGDDDHLTPIITAAGTFSPVTSRSFTLPIVLVAQSPGQGF